MAAQTLNSTYNTFPLENDDDISLENIQIDNDEIKELRNIVENERPNIIQIIRECHVENELRQDLEVSLLRGFSVSDDLTESQDRECSYEAPICFSCAEQPRLTSGHDVKKGMHLVFGRYIPITKANDTIKKVFEFVTEKMGFKQPFLYHHHAIITEVIATANNSAKVKLVEFTSIGSFTFKVVESKYPVDLDLGDKNIFYKQYKRNKYSPEEIVTRARSCIGQDNYNVMKNNCEHVAVWCVSGEKVSYQADEFDEKRTTPVLSWLGSIVSKLASLFFTITDDIYFSTSKLAKLAVLALPALVFAGVFILVELVISIFRFIHLRQQKRQGKICKRCFNKKKVYLISKIASSSFATIALSAIPASGGQAFALIGASIGLGIATIFVLPCLISFLYGMVKQAINPLYDVEKVVAETFGDICQGSVLTIPNDHDILVNDVVKLPRTNDSCYAHLKIVHFGWQVGKGRSVVNEIFHFNLEKDLFKIMDIPRSLTFQNDEVVKNALREVGKRNFNAISYRSSHMSKFCKIKNYKKDFHSLFPLFMKSVPSTKRNVKTASDIKTGDMVEFNYYGLPHVGIVVKKLPANDRVEIEYYHVDKVVRLEKKVFDLEKRDILLHNYSSEECNEIDEIMQRAENALGSKVFKHRPYRSSKFAEQCVKK